MYQWERLEEIRETARGRACARHWERAEVGVRPRSAELPTKRRVTLRVDPDVLAFYNATGPGWQTRINRALRGRWGRGSGVASLTWAVLTWESFGVALVPNLPLGGRRELEEYFRNE